MIEEKFLTLMQENGYFQKHRKILVALSGGLDSMTLLHLLYRFRTQLDIELVLAHVNHQQRSESKEEEKKLREISQELELEFHVAYFEGTFSESKARDFRYSFFKDIMYKTGCTALVTAHHADDQVETILMKMIRGSRLLDLSGIQVRQTFGTGELIRPLLPFYKEEFPEIFHFEDASNQEDTYFRNRTRNIYIPLLSKENPQIKKAIIHFGAELADLKLALKELTADLDIRNIDFFHKQSPHLQTYLLQEYLESFPDLQLSREQFQQVLKILNTKANYCHPLKNGYELKKDYHSFQIRKISPESDSQEQNFLLKFGEILEVGDYLVSFGIPLDFSKKTQIIYVSRETELRVRCRKKGDTIRLQGYTKKIRRLFIDKKIPMDERNNPILVEQNQIILGILGIAISDLSQNLKNDIMGEKLYIQKIDR